MLAPNWGVRSLLGNPGSSTGDSQTLVAIIVHQQTIFVKLSLPNIGRLNRN